MGETAMPTAIICSRTAGSREAGPIVATILVDRIGEVYTSTGTG